MELLIALVVIVVIAWFWRVRQADKQTMQDFDAWLHQYHTATSASKRSRTVSYTHLTLPTKA